MPEGLPEEIQTEGPNPAEGFENGLAMIESALEGAPPELAEQARQHLNALREIGAEMGAGGEESPPAPGPSEEVPSETDRAGMGGP